MNIRRPRTFKNRGEEVLEGYGDVYRLIVDMAEEGIWILDDRDRTLFINPKLGELLGYSKSEMLGRPVYDFSDEANVAILRSALSRRRRGVKETYSVQLRKKNGDRLPSLIAATPLFDANDRYRGSLGLIMDNTRMAEAESKLGASERLFRLVADFTYDWEIFDDVDGKPIYISPSCERITGYSAAQFYAEPRLLNRIIYPADREVFSRHQAVHRGGPAAPGALDFRIVTAAGEVRWISHVCQSVFASTGEWLGYRVNNRDTTDRKLAEERLQMTQFAVDHFTDSSIWLDQGGRIFYVNDATCRSTGYSKDELLSMHIWDIDPLYSPEIFAQNWLNWEETSGRNIESRFESVHRAKSGKLFPVEITGNFFIFRGQKFFVTYDRDISERKQTEQALLAAKSQAELYLDLMGHDITNMNQALMGYLELIDATSEPAKIDREMIARSIEIIHRSSRLIEEVKKLTLVQSGKVPLKVVDICAVLSDVKSRFASLGDPRVTIRFAPAAEACIARADDLVKDVFDSLVDNAIKHSRGPVTIDLATGRESVDSRQYVMVTVTDTGPGIPDDLKRDLFAPAEGMSEKAIRRGFGLYLVRTLVEHYGGSVWVEDRVPGNTGLGTRFVVLLPSA